MTHQVLFDDKNHHLDKRSRYYRWIPFLTVLLLAVNQCNKIYVYSIIVKTVQYIYDIPKRLALVLGSVPLLDTILKHSPFLEFALAIYSRKSSLSNLFLLDLAPSTVVRLFVFLDSLEFALAIYLRKSHLSNLYLIDLALIRFQVASIP